MGLGLTSFPIQKSKENKINEAILTEWTKNYDIPGVVGNDIVKLMQESLDKYNIPVRIDAVCNDSIGTLLYGGFEKKGCRVGVILDDHTNAAYIEPNKE